MIENLSIMKKFLQRLFLPLLFCSFPFGLLAQEVTLSGIVTDQANIPLPGVSILIKGTAIGTVTNFEGEFSLVTQEENAILVFSYLGFETQELSIGDQTNFEIVLIEDTQALNEVVVVGYGETRAEDLINAVSSVDIDGMSQRPVVDVGSSLQGLSPGLNVAPSTGKVGVEPTINIRGFTSINGGQPLIIIDGVEGRLSDLNPNDVESISVLKDAGASAIYGARGAFGVVLVTTKNARRGKVTVNAGSTIAFRTPTRNTDYLTDPYESTVIMDESFRTANGVSYSGYTDADMAALLEVSKNPSLARVEIQNRNGQDQYVHYGYTDWWKTFFREFSPSQIYHASVSGGSENIKTHFSYRNYQSKGILKVQDDTYQKYNLRGKVDVKVTDWLTFSNNMQYNSSQDLEHGGTQYGYRKVMESMIYVHALPSYMPTNPDGTALWRTELNNYTVGDGAYAGLLQGTAQQQIDMGNFSNIASIELTPFPQLKINANYAIRRDEFKQYQRSTRIPYSIYPGQVELFGTDQLTEFRTSSAYDALNIYGEYSMFLGDHKVKTMVGFNQEEYWTKGIEASRQNLISDNLNALGLGTDNPMATGDASEWSLRGLFYRVSYDYQNKYLVEFNGRYDATSRFPSGHRWGFFPSASVGWLLNKEKFFQDITDVFDMFKIRASYGSMGNQNIDDYAYYPTLANGLNNNYILGGELLNYTYSPDLNPSQITWEEVSTLNLGANFNLLDNRLSIGFDWFQRNTDGMLAEGAVLPAVLGAASPLENAADLRTRGFELSVGFSDSFEMAKKPLTYSVIGNLSNSITKITKFDNPNKSLVDFYEGMTIGELWGYEIDGLFQSQEEIDAHADQSFVSTRIYSTSGLLPGDMKFRDLNGDGEINEGENTFDNPGDRSVVGNSAPQYIYSFMASAEWNGFDFSAFFQGVGKQDWYPHGDSRLFWAAYSRPYNSFIRKDLANDIWSPENPNGYYPRLRGYTALDGSLDKINDRYLQSVAYLRLKNLSIGYTLPTGFISESPTTKLRVYLSGENLLTFSSLTDYIDPEAASNSLNLNRPSTSSNRSKAQTVPFSKIYSLGLTFQF